jgi:hypothetical protein
MLTAERLREVLSYEKSTGIMRWLVQTSNRIRVGDIAGSSRVDGYRQIVIDGVSYLAQRLCVLHQTGEWPANKVPRRNLDREDNRWQNICTA